MAYYNSGEADRFLVCFTEDFGMLRIFAKSIRMTKSKLNRHAQLFSHSRLAFVYGRDFLRLVDAETIIPFAVSGLGLMTVGKISRLITRLVNGEERDDKLWQLLDSAFSYLRGTPQIPEDFDLLFGVRALHRLGYVGKLPGEIKTVVENNDWDSGIFSFDNNALKYSLLPIFNTGLRVSQL